MFNSLGDILTAGPVSPDRSERRSVREERTGQPVRRHSHRAGRCEGTFWRRTTWADSDRIVKAAQKYELALKQKGKHNGPLGGVGIEVLTYLANLVNRTTGRLDPSIERIMRKLRRSRDAVTRALKALRDHGFLDWLRRYVETGTEGRGPRVQQTSNAYRLSLPPRAARLLPKPAPVPDDFAHRQAAQAQERADQEATLSIVERTRLIVDDDSPLAATLLRFAAAVEADQRGSASRSESLFKDIS